MAAAHESGVPPLGQAKGRLRRHRHEQLQRHAAAGPGVLADERGCASPDQTPAPWPHPAILPSDTPGGGGQGADAHGIRRYDLPQHHQREEPQHREPHLWRCGGGRQRHGGGVFRSQHLPLGDDHGREQVGAGGGLRQEDRPSEHPPHHGQWAAWPIPGRDLFGPGDGTPAPAAPVHRLRADDGPGAVFLHGLDHHEVQPGRYPLQRDRRRGGGRSRLQPFRGPAGRERVRHGSRYHQRGAGGGGCQVR